MTARLPQEEVDFLRYAEGDGTRIIRRIAALHRVGWTVRELARAMQKSSSTIHYWVSQYPAINPIDYPRLPIPDRKPKNTKVVRQHVSMSYDQEYSLRRLAVAAKGANRHVGTEAHEASFRLTVALKHHHNDRMVSVTRLADITGLSKSAIVARLK